jgi:hypothetical protein
MQRNKRRLWGIRLLIVKGHPMQRLRLLGATGLAAIGMLMGSQAALSGGSEGWVRYKPGYEGYHLRPPYYLPEVGWYTPPDFHDRSLYFGYHFHQPGKPLLARPRYRVVRLTSAHVEWCRAAYVSYRPEDNSFVAYSGHRKQCRSPYM